MTHCPKRVDTRLLGLGVSLARSLTSRYIIPKARDLRDCK